MPFRLDPTRNNTHRGETALGVSSVSRKLDTRALHCDPTAKNDLPHHHHNFRPEWLPGKCGRLPWRDPIKHVLFLSPNLDAFQEYENFIIIAADNDNRTRLPTTITTTTPATELFPSSFSLFRGARRRKTIHQLRKAAKISVSLVWPERRKKV